MSDCIIPADIMISILLEFYTKKDENIERELNQIGVRLLKKPHRLIGLAGGSEIWMGHCPLSVLQGGQLASVTSIKLAWIGLEGSIKLILRDSSTLLTTGSKK